MKMLKMGCAGLNLISCPDEENQNCKNYSETVSSQLYTTILKDGLIVKINGDQRLIVKLDL